MDSDIYKINSKTLNTFFNLQQNKQENVQISVHFLSMKHFFIMIKI